MSNNIPYDKVAEECLIGAMVLSQGAALLGVENCTVNDFYLPLHIRIFGAIERLVARGASIDAVTITSEMGNADALSDIVSMSMNVPSANNVLEYAKIVTQHSASRKLLGHYSESISMVNQGISPYTIAEGSEKFVSSIGVSTSSTEPQAMTIDELEMCAEDLAPVVIPGMMHKDFRTIVVAEEGAGKSLLLRTIAMSASQGFHPFSHQRIDPVRALVIDLENPAQAILQTAAPFNRHLRHAAGDMYDSERFRLFRKPGGMEIRRLADRAEIQREIAAHRPDLVCIGPIYKMYHRGANESYEDSADEAMAVLDDLRTKYEFALIMEHHAAKGKAGERRELSPMGSQRWMAWPEIGISLYKDTADPTVMHVKRYRGDRLSGVSWPDKLVRDRTWLLDGVWTKGLDS